MRAAALLLVFILAKMFILCGNATHVTAWWPVAYAWQDATVALVFGVLDRVLQRLGASPWIAIMMYWTAATYAAINIPVGRAVFSPLTRPMLRAARGPLADSVLLYVNGTNIILVSTVLMAAAGLPCLLRRVPRSLGMIALACAIVAVPLGPIACRRVDTGGMDRNVITALIGIGLPLSSGRPLNSNWRESQFQAGRATEDLSRFGGAAKGFNVVMIGLESTAAQYLSLYGSEYDVMPNLGALARRALVFDNAYAVYPESIKGLFSVLCSTFPAFDSVPEQYESVECRSIAAVLADNGYHTALFHSGRFGYLGMNSIVTKRGYQTLEDAGEVGGKRNSSFGVDEPVTVGRMLAWIDAIPREQPFFLTYLPVAGHHPYATPDPGPFDGTVEINQYRNALHYGDIALGAFVKGLRVRGLEKNTVWVIYGDHGEAFHQHEGNYGHTFFLYEENIHVPFLIAAPRLNPVQIRVRKVVSLVDVAPTILDLLGVASPAIYQGQTVLDKAPRMALFFADYSLGLLGLRDGPWKFVYEVRSGRSRLFDLEHDWREVSDVSTREVSRATWYARLLRDWSIAQKRYIASRN